MGHRHTPHRLVSGSIPGGAHQSSLAEQRVPVIPIRSFCVGFQEEVSSSRVSKVRMSLVHPRVREAGV